MRQITDEPTRATIAEGQRISPKIPLEDNDRERTHTRPDHGEGRLSPRKARVEKSEAGNHEEDHA
jgi:hypothetical protein